ncbi:MAG: hypothetical protein LBH93_08215 [Chitinispirillales bacterium]|nr:hypothetical protein [Chitinispirillales bacterium]
MVSALPGGNRNSNGSFNNVGNNGNWWSATENGSGNAYNRNMNSGNDNVNENNNDKKNGFSVRCAQDCAGGGCQAVSPLFFLLCRTAFRALQGAEGQKRRGRWF